MILGTTLTGLTGLTDRKYLEIFKGGSFLE